MTSAHRRISILALAAVAGAPAAVAAAHPATAPLRAHAADKPDKAEKPEKDKTNGNGNGNNGNGNGNGGSSTDTGSTGTGTGTGTSTGTGTPSTGNGNGNQGNGKGNGGPAATVTPTPTPTPGSGAATGTPTTDDAATTPATTTPVKGKSAVGQVASGTVTVTLPGDTEATPLAGGTVPLGATVDATQGKVRILTALPGGETQAATFWGGEFKLAQSKDDGKVSIQMPKVSVASCSPSVSGVIASASKAKGGAKKRLKSLWVRDDHGKFDTHGRNSVATVRGTVWVTRERCDGTFTYVRKGHVDVVDRNTGRHVHLHAGSGYLARS